MHVGLHRNSELKIKYSRSQIQWQILVPPWLGQFFREHKLIITDSVKILNARHQFVPCFFIETDGITVRLLR